MDKKRIPFFLLICFIIFCSVKGFPCEGCKKCRQIPPVNDFDYKQFAGDWYVVDKSSPDSEKNVKCSFSNVTYVNESFVNFHKLSLDVRTNKPTVIDGYMKRRDESTPGILVIGPSTIENRQNLTIVDVQYDSFVLVHVCTRSKSSETEIAWIISRTRYLPLEKINTAKEKLKSYGFDVDHFTAVDQINC